ncbi:uncharacterized protein C8R40DRAFT_1076430 [Lentinula edodes]|uniref:uncharacterized protein n=1 Tax=Lentinula edodes TaxID=5353 RepID=UPI001E8E7437|nr:uncharacterized protein C8R40DRAFT_1076430 [Lentinula edodes]KAH7881083.1 hypothetical protein C8R40DRAFT_1076430 [Lentinula edodes]
MPAPSVSPQPDCRNNHDTDPFVLYSRSVHDYTLRLWAESRKLAEEKARARSKDAALYDARWKLKHDSQRLSSSRTHASA